MNDPSLDVAYYRIQNRDLCDLGMSDAELRSHFIANGRSEPRSYAPVSTTTETFSMRWLRGRGLEVGAGKNPVPTFGDARVEFGEFDRNLAFGGSGSTHWLDIGGDAPKNLRSQFDFAVASHVLEHCDSLARGIINLLDTVRSGGLAYIILPDKRYLGDQFFIADFEITHHVEEYSNPLLYADIHDTAYIAHAEKEASYNEHAFFSEEYRQQLINGKLDQSNRFLHHKHNYSFDGWLSIMIGIQDYIGGFSIEDISFGRERFDCHYILRKTPSFEPTPPLGY